jgi:hypothetical protein
MGIAYIHHRQPECSIHTRYPIKITAGKYGTQYSNKLFKSRIIAPLVMGLGLVRFVFL